TPSNSTSCPDIAPSRKGFQRMAHLTIKLHACPSGDPCPLCGHGTPPAAGPRLCLTDREVVVCDDCGRKHAPSLSALVDLAKVAQGAGRLGRHTLAPPMPPLLDLARAAKNYLPNSTKNPRRAA